MIRPLTTTTEWKYLAVSPNGCHYRGTIQATSRIEAEAKARKVEPTGWTIANVVSPEEARYDFHHVWRA